MENVEIEVKFEVTPLGQLSATWIIPNVIISNLESFSIEIPGFKYDLPSFASIPVPFSSRGFELAASNISFPKSHLDGKMKSTLYSNKLLHFKLRGNQVSSSTTTIRYSIPNIVNHDGVYFVMVYPFRSPFEGIKHNIELKAKLSYNIRKFKFWERYFAYPSNAKLVFDSVFNSQKNGDEIIVSGTFIPTYNRTLDLHLTATRFPILIRRDVFWMIVFAIFLLVALSPYIVAIIDSISK
jgi:hypothetical protein